MSDLEIVVGGTLKMFEIWGTLLIVGVATLVLLWMIEKGIEKAQGSTSPKSLFISMINFLLS